MPYGHRWAKSNFEKLANGRNHSICRRSVDKSNQKFFLREPNLLELASRDSEQRFPLFAIIFVDTHASWKLSPLCSPLPEVVQRNNLESLSPSNMNGSEPTSSLLFMVGLHAANADSARLNSSCISSETGSSDQSESSNKLSDPPVSLSSTLPDCLTSGRHLDNNLSDEAATSGSFITDTSVEKDDSTHNTNFVDCSTSLLSCTSYSDEMDGFETVTSPQRLAGDELGSNTTGSCAIKDAEMVPFKLDRRSKKDHFRENNICHDNFSCISMCNNNNPAVDSSLDGCNSDIGENSSDDTAMRLVIKDESGPSSSEGEIISPSEELMQCDTSSHATADLCNLGTHVSKDNSSSDAYLSNDVLDACSSTERVDCSSQAGSSNDFHPVIYERRGRRSRRMIGHGNLNGANGSITAKIHSHTGEDINYSIWQKVKKNEKNECVSKANNVSVLYAQHDVSSKDTKMKMKPDKFIGQKQKQSGITCKYPKAEPSQVSSRGAKTSPTLSKATFGSAKNKSSSVIKHANQNHLSGSYIGKGDMPNSPKHHFQQKECRHNSPFEGLNKHSSTGFGSHSNSSSQRCLSKLTDSIDCCLGHSEKEICVLMGAAPQGIVCDGIRHLDVAAAFSEIDHMATTSNQFGQRQIDANCENGTTKHSKDIQEDLSSVGIEDYGCTKPNIESHREANSLSSNGSPIQKWVPVGRKDSIASDMGYLDCLKVSVMDEAVLDHSYPKTAEVEDVNKDGDISNSEANKLTNKLSTYPNSTEVLDIHAVINCQTHKIEDKEFIGFETDLDKIIGAVKNAYELQTAVESVQLVTGSPVADFEKFLFSAAPVIGRTQNSRSCNSCSHERLKDSSLCWHEIPNISLKSIWQWYEELGCFGLEVKAHDFYNSRRLRNGCHEFTAYFVPYLSAVQLFGISRSTKYCNLNGQSARASEGNKTAKSLGSLPIFSMLLPQPTKDKGACFSDSSSSAKAGFFDKGIDVDHEEIIFEYFESEQPPWRHPLYEKIKELVASGSSSDSRMFGDPSKLESVKLHDLHPASWYCIAWYPIYRIPDGSFHAAFLTYHSLGHFVHRSSPESGHGLSEDVVSPVVGLQTYNHKGESWFQPRHMNSKVVQSEDVSNSDTSELIKERLRTLRQTASVMARAVVSKGNQRYVNRHPDYNFFVSRSG
ncbi:uncharacterized protein LOC135598601 isoform X2 [Musa acuminata AAA Group]|uniref:uncharacterized protein LOC135598601 isoform X2 n=1 Tax=Musa acuminata AAA Group TaxID=214697 RepID=UPI0031DFE5BF